ncbi:hypothetical protein MASR1M31_13020 [Porphyromonadaceae bacterium]
MLNLKSDELAENLFKDILVLCENDFLVRMSAIKFLVKYQTQINFKTICASEKESVYLDTQIIL